MLRELLLVTTLALSPYQTSLRQYQQIGNEPPPTQADEFVAPIPLEPLPGVMLPRPPTIGEYGKDEGDNQFIVITGSSTAGRIQIVEVNTVTPITGTNLVISEGVPTLQIGDNQLIIGQELRPLDPEDPNRTNLNLYKPDGTTYKKITPESAGSLFPYYPRSTQGTFALVQDLDGNSSIASGLFHQLSIDTTISDTLQAHSVTNLDGQPIDLGIAELDPISGPKIIVQTLSDGELSFTAVDPETGQIVQSYESTTLLKNGVHIDLLTSEGVTGYTIQDIQHSAFSLGVNEMPATGEFVHLRVQAIAKEDSGTQKFITFAMQTNPWTGTIGYSHLIQSQDYTGATKVSKGEPVVVKDIYGNNDGMHYAINAAGNTIAISTKEDIRLFTLPRELLGNQSIVVGDIDGDNSMETICITGKLDQNTDRISGYITIVNLEDGTVLWESENLGGIQFPTVMYQDGKAYLTVFSGLDRYEDPKIYTYKIADVDSREDFNNRFPWQVIYGNERSGSPTQQKDTLFSSYLPQIVK